MRRDYSGRRTCPTCRMHWQLPPMGRDNFNPREVDPKLVRWFENAARVFDEESDALFTAEEFIAWLKPDLTGRHVPFPFIDGKRRGKNGIDNLADPLPYYARPSGRRVA